ncbi:hypothetical protein ABFS83_14G083900 [Erythranthe nasuta]
MDKISLSFFLLCCLLAIGCCHGKRPWCVADTNGPPAPSDAQFQGFIDYACGIVDCSPIQPGGSCYNPNYLVRHADYALNLFYKSRGVCNTEIGTITSFDPSYTGCYYP